MYILSLIQIWLSLLHLNIRREAIEDIGKLNLPEDVSKREEDKIQNLVNEYNKKVEELLKAKEQELLTV